MAGFGLELEQAELNDDVERIREWGDANPDAYGGLWFDNDSARAGTGPVLLTLAVTSEPDEVVKQLRQTVPHPKQLRVVRCRWSYSELSDLRDLIWRERAGPPFEGTFITTGGIDEMANVVKIGISTGDQEFASELLTHYGSDRVRVELNVRPIRFNR